MRAKALLNQSQSSHTTHVLFIINLPVQVAQSSFVGFQGDPWVSCHIDELRPGEKGAITLEGAQGVAVSELFYGGMERKPLQYERQESDFTRNVEGMVFEHMMSTENEENWEQEEEEHEVEEETTYKEKVEEMMEIVIEGGEEEGEEDEKVVEIEEEENMEEEAAETGSEENGKGETKETGSEVSSEEEQEKTGSEVSSEEEQEKTGSEVNEKTGEDEARSEKISEEEESENSEVEQDMKETGDREKSGDMQVEDDLSSSYSTQTPEEHMDDKEKVRNSPNDVEITASVNTMSQRMKTYSDMYKQCVRLNSCVQAAASRLQVSNKQRATERVHLLINIIPRKPVFPLGTYNLLASVPGVPCLCVYCAH